MRRVTTHMRTSTRSLNGLLVLRADQLCLDFLYRRSQSQTCCSAGRGPRFPNLLPEAQWAAGRTAGSTFYLSCHSRSHAEAFESRAASDRARFSNAASSGRVTVSRGRP